MNEREKIADYKNRIAKLEAEIANKSIDDPFERMDIIEAKSEIRDYRDRIARLERRINGEGEPGIPTDAQLAASDWALSEAYDD